MNKILAAWAWNGPVSEPIAYGEGHINQTYALTEQATQKRYILQKINTDTFKDPDGLMENICGVTDFLREKAKQRGADPERATLHVALTKAGKPYYKAADGGCWRVYDFVENTVCLQQVQSAEDFYQSAVAFGNFQHQLADYPANTLHETIPHFHDTPKRFADFQRAVAEDRMGRAAQVQREIEFVRAREADYHVMVDLLAAGKLPLRVTHNDTKLNNILLDKTTGEGLCVIDLDDLTARKEEENTTLSLLRGECEAFRQRGAKLAGLDVYISSNVPKGSGVSSSAAFEVLIGVILNDCFMTDKVSPIEIAQIGQWAENVYFGKPCGLMDQMASSVGNIITIDFADKANPDVEPVQVDFSQAGLALCILDSGADHADLTDEYAAIPNECRAVAAVCGGQVLRDVPFETFIANLPACRKQCGDRAVLRAFHIYADNQRVARQVNALRAGDFETFLQLVNESGTSSWEYLQNVIPAGYKEHQEVAVTIAAAKHFLNGAGAVRVHGGGFAGTVQAFVPLEKLDAPVRAILRAGLAQAKFMDVPVSYTHLTLPTNSRV